MCEPRLDARELEYITDCVQTGWISSAGPYLDRFEKAWAAYCGRRHGVAVANGTVALEAAVRCLDLQPGDEVVLPTFTIISCVLAVLRGGAHPVLVDSDPNTWCLDVGQVEAALTPRTRAIMPVHIYGHPVDMDPLLELADQHDLLLIEDAAEAHGGQYLRGWRDGTDTWQTCGSFGVVSCFSFYANKIISTGEGGMVLTDDPTLAGRLRSLRNLYFEPERRFHHAELGCNFRLTNLQAAVGLAQLETIEERLEHKRWLGKAYQDRLGRIPGLSLQTIKPWARPVYWMFGVVVDEQVGKTAADLSDHLASRGVMTRPFFRGMHEQPAFHRMGLFEDERYPVAERLASQGLYLPSGPTLTPAQLEQVCDAVASAVG